MYTMEWDSNAIRTHLKATSQRLGQLQAKMDADGTIMRKDIATLLQQGNVGLARAKVQKLIQEDAQGDLMEIIENEIGTLLEHFVELYSSSAPTPVVAEAVSSIIHTAPHLPCKELQHLSQLLAHRFGPDFSLSAVKNKDEHVSPRIIRILAAPTPTAATLNNYLVSISRTYRVEWEADPGRQDVVNVLSEILNPGEGKEVDMVALRRFCSYGIPDEPSWLRPRIWKLFLGLLPPKQDNWTRDIAKQRDLYYDLVRRLLKPYTSLPEPSTPPHPSDETLLNIVHHLSRIPRELFGHLEDAPEDVSPCPLSEASDDEITAVPHASALDKRLQALKRGLPNPAQEPEDVAPAISISNYDTISPETSKFKPLPKSTFPRAYQFGDAHPYHCSAILRLLFIHAAINPGQFSPHIPALLVPLYTALRSEVVPEDLAHVEADTFWLFEEIVAEFSDVDEGEGSQKWMLKLDQALAQADSELHESLRMKGLRPSLPHYSYRWLAPVLTYTIPVPAIFVFWDALFSCPRRERDHQPKLERLVDLACAMILALRKELSSLGHIGEANSNGKLWADEDAEPVAADNDPFLEGMTLLQAYPRTSVADAERIVQMANDLLKRRELEVQKSQPAHDPSGAVQTGFGARIRHSMWKGFTNQIDDSDDSSPENSDSDRERRKEDGNETERPSEASATSTKSWWTSIAAPRLTITSADTTAALPSQEEEAGYSSSASKAGIWSYAEKLRDSDTAASLAKVGTNWRARALTVGTSWTQKKPAEAGQPPLGPGKQVGNVDRRHSSMKSHSRSPRHGSPASSSNSPTHSRAGSLSTHSSNSSLSPLSPDDPGVDEFGFVDKTKALLSFGGRSPIPSLSKSSTKAKSGPRPLLLNSASPITSPPLKETTPDSSQWSEVMKAKKRYLNRDARSSVSSLSPSEALKSSRSDWESDSGSRLVPLNRRSVSPMAPSYRINPRSATSEPFSPSALSTSTSASAPLQSVPVTKTISRGSVIQQSPTLPRLETKNSLTSSMGDTPDVQLQPSSSLSRHGRVRRATKPARLQLKESPVDARTPAIANGSLTVEWPGDDAEVVATPRAMTFDTSADEGDSQPPPVSPRLRRRKVSMDRPGSRKPSGDSEEARLRKTSSRSRKLSSAAVQKDPKKHNRRESAADEGDDEGYDDLLSAYESEDLGSQRFPSPT